MNTQEYKTKLEAEKLLVEGELGGLGRFNDDLGEWEATPEEQANPEADENDLADRSEDFEERYSTLATLSTRLDDIKSALMKINAGTYGMCEVCGNKIEEDRLSVNPAARTCKACMEK